MSHQIPTGNKCGFTLLEVAVLIFVAGLLASITVTLLPALIESKKADQTRTALEQVDYSLQGYIAALDRFPCPDTDGDGLENRINGGTPADYSDDSCASYAGRLPGRTLGLATDSDGNRNPLRIGVHADLIKTVSTSELCARINRLQTAVTSTAKLHIIAPDGTVSNQALVIASGGLKDLDSTNGLFDNNNGASPAPAFDSPDKTATSSYDDVVRAESFLNLWQNLCPGVGTGETTYSSGCSNGSDDDGDSFSDCDDQDCCVDPDCIGTGAC
ncbi:MAG: hypothetical protein GY868_19195 [Deltaproteobacteria bacterium]|nr:hypothetical protein [Deltaproteobacteria bacterium]